MRGYYNDKKYLFITVDGEGGKSKLIVKIQCNLIVEHWVSLYPEIERELSDYQRKNISAICIDLSKCREIAPFALMEMILLLKKLKETNGLSITVELPEYNASSDRKETYSINETLKYMATDGFLVAMLKEGFTVLARKPQSERNRNSFQQRSYSRQKKQPKKQLVTEIDINRYCNYKINSKAKKIYPFSVYNLNYQKREEIVSQIEDELSLCLKNTMSLQSFNQLSVIVYNILSEVIENVEKHAYPNSKDKTFGIYIRSRDGMSNWNAEDEELRKFKKSLKDEETKSPALDNSILEKNERILEIFFCDLGIGLSGSLASYYAEYKKQYNYPIRELFGRILKHSLRQNRQEDSTPYGGLHFVCRLLSETNGYIWCGEGREWVGAQSYDIEHKDISSEGVCKVALTDSVRQSFGQGLKWCFRIPYNESLTKRTGLFVSWGKSPKKHPVYQAYCLSNCGIKEIQDLSIHNVACRDDVYGNRFIMDGEPDTWTMPPTSIKNLDALVWLPGKSYSKNVIYKTINELVELKGFYEARGIKYSSNEISQFFPLGLRLIIGDVDPSDMLTYYYVFNELALTNARSIILDVIIVTNTWDVLYFSSFGSTMLRDTTQAQEYLSFQRRNTLNPYSGIVAYALFLRKYHSALFWRMVNERENEGLYFNDNVFWDRHGSRQVCGYLNFERIQTIPAIYNLLMKCLSRTAGYFHGTTIEAINTDYDSKKICQDFNSRTNMSAQPDGHVFVSTVCVSGYTQSAVPTYNSGSEPYDKISTAFFVNPTYYNEEQREDNIPNISCLLVWPTKKFLSSYKSAGKDFYRLGRTSLISSIPNYPRIDVTLQLQKTVRNKEQTYDDLQQMHPPMLKFGHYCSDSHHYLIGLDLINYMKYSYMKRQGAFVDVLWKIVNFLRAPNSTPYDYSALDNAWKTVLKKMPKTPGAPGTLGDLVLYHANSITDSFMCNIKEIVPSEISKRILSITLYETQANNTTLSVSPFSLYCIKNVINRENATKRILFIDSTFSTGRRISEIENIMQYIGCESVEYYSIVDMRRLMGCDKKSSSYWHINVPRLGDKNTCVLCNVREKLLQLREKVDAVLRKRIDEWLRSWEAISLNVSLQRHGIPPKQINKFSHNGVTLSNSTALSVYVAEQLSETFDDEIVYRLLDSQTSWELDVRMQIICTQLCLFGNNYSRQILLSLLSELIYCLARYEGDCEAAYLAGITLIMQQPNVIYELLNQVVVENPKRENPKPKLTRIREELLNSQNCDLAVVFCYFVKQSHLIEALLNDTQKDSAKTNPSSYRGFIDLINEHILPESDLKHLARELLGLLENEYGEDHGTNINKYLKESSNGRDAVVKKSTAANNDIRRLHDIAERLPFAAMSSRAQITREDFYNNGKRVSRLTDLINSDIENYTELLNNYPRKPYNVSETLGNSISACKRFYEEIRNGYFISSESECIDYLEKMVQNCQTMFRKKIEFSHSNSMGRGQKKWYYWNCAIEKEFIYFIQNVSHCKKMVDSDNCFMKVNVCFDFDFLEIKITSWSSESTVSVENTFLQKNRAYKEQCAAFDVLFAFENEGQPEGGQCLLKTTMKVPSAFQSITR